MRTSTQATLLSLSALLLCVTACRATGQETAPESKVAEAKPATAAPAAPAGKSALTLDTEDKRTVYALGVVMSQNLATFNLSEAEIDIVAAGLRDGVLGREPQVDIDAYRLNLQELSRQRAAAAAEVEKKAGNAFVEKAAAEKGAVKTESGIVIKEINPGKGASPAATDKVKVHYHGTLTDGTVFDSSVERGEPATFPLNGVIPCWTEGVQKMKVGGKSRLICPSDKAYGDRGSPPKIKPGATLVFDVELLEIVKE